MTNVSTLAPIATVPRAKPPAGSPVLLTGRVCTSCGERFVSTAAGLACPACGGHDTWPTRFRRLVRPDAAPIEFYA